MKNRLSILIVISFIMISGCKADSQLVAKENLEDLPEIEGTKVIPGTTVDTKLELDVSFEEVNATIINEVNAVVLRMNSNLLFSYSESEFPKDYTRERAVTQFQELINSFIGLDPDTNVTINVYTDDKNETESNLQLTKARANYLLKLFENQEELNHLSFDAEGYGEEYPIAPNDGNLENQEMNRRIEFVIRP